MLLGDKHDLIHKAVGWMLREIGKKSQVTEESFLNKFYKKMPRTTLRYSIERFAEPKRKMYLSGLVDIKSGRVHGPFDSVNDLVKSLKKRKKQTR